MRIPLGVLAALLAGAAACGPRIDPALDTDATGLQDYTDYGEKPVYDEVKSLPLKEIVWKHKFSSEISRVTLGSTYLYLETPYNEIIAVDRFSGVAAWKYDVDTNTPLDFPPVEAYGVPERIRDLEERLFQKNREIDNMLKTKGPGEETRKLQKDRDQLREQLNVEQFGDNVYFMSRQRLYCLARTTGKLLWSKLVRTFIPAARPFAIRTHLFIAGSELSRVWAIDINRKGDDVAFYRCSIGAHDKAITAQPFYQDPSLYFVSHDGNIYSYPLTGDKWNWTYATEDEIWADPLVHIYTFPYKDDKGKDAAFKVTYLFVGSLDHCFYALDATGGTLLWKYETAGKIKTGAVAKDQTVYVATEGGALFAFDIFPMHRNKEGKIDVPKAGGEWRWKRSGIERWRLPLGERFLVKGKELVYVMGPNAEMYAMEEMTGKIIGRYRFHYFAHVLTNPIDNILYVANPAGYVYALREPKD
jgi:outer membrane protein assembly factor BamB